MIRNKIGGQNYYRYENTTLFIVNFANSTHSLHHFPIFPATFLLPSFSSILVIFLSFIIPSLCILVINKEKKKKMCIHLFHINF